MSSGVLVRHNESEYIELDRTFITIARRILFSRPTTTDIFQPLPPTFSRWGGGAYLANMPLSDVVQNVRRRQVFS